MRHGAVFALGNKRAQRDLQIGAGIAAQAAVAQQGDLVGAAAQQSIVDADAAEFIDDDSGALPFRRWRGSGGSASSFPRRETR